MSASPFTSFSRAENMALVRLSECVYLIADWPRKLCPAGSLGVHWRSLLRWPVTGVIGTAQGCRRVSPWCSHAGATLWRDCSYERIDRRVTYK